MEWINIPIKEYDRKKSNQIRSNDDWNFFLNHISNHRPGTDKKKRKNRGIWLLNYSKQQQLINLIVRITSLMVNNSDKNDDEYRSSHQVIFYEHCTTSDQRTNKQTTTTTKWLDWLIDWENHHHQSIVSVIKWIIQ